MPNQTFTVDPVTRIEGHLGIEVNTDNNSIVTGVQCQTKLFRGFELIMRDRNPRDAVILTQRI
jgi:hydrogenase large subunit